MVKRQDQDNAERCENQGQNGCEQKASRIGPSTAYACCRERLSPFGGLLGLVKFLDLVKFKEIFEGFYKPPERMPEMGHYHMVYGILLLLFIGFTRVWHFLYIQFDAVVCGIFNRVKLPYVTTYWRYVDSLGINQGMSLLMVMSALRERVWQLCGLSYKTIHINIDTTVETIYGSQQGGRKGHNPKNRGKKGFRPVLCFIHETREYIMGKLRKGATIGGEEVAALIRVFKKYLPGCVKEVILRGDGEFISWEAVKAAREEGFHYIFGNKVCKPPFDPAGWYQVRKQDVAEYNEVLYQPAGWGEACRFVSMRIPKEAPSEGNPQLELLEDANYKYRTFVTDRTQPAHRVIEEYDPRADCENLIGEAKREGLEAIPSRKFGNNYAYFQIVMLAYNIWRSFKMLAAHGLRETEGHEPTPETVCKAQEIVDHTIRMGRLKLLFIAAKVATHSGTTEVKYSRHDSRVAGLFRFLKYLDKRRQQVRPWLSGKLWECNHLSFLGIPQAAVFR
ncbi:MAG: transposase [Thermoplasmata archaeon]|nr:transposase [Thermoplasmata archaeon]